MEATKDILQAAREHPAVGIRHRVEGALMGFRQDPRLEREAGRERFGSDKRFVLENDAALRLEFAPEDLSIQASDVALRAGRADPLVFLQYRERVDGIRSDLDV